MYLPSKGEEFLFFVVKKTLFAFASYVWDISWLENVWAKLFSHLVECNLALADSTSPEINDLFIDSYSEAIPPNDLSKESICSCIFLFTETELVESIELANTSLCCLSAL